MAEGGDSTPRRPPALQSAVKDGGFSPPSKDHAPRSPPAHLPPHRTSISDQLRSHPSSPRAHRHPSLSQQAIQDLMNNPPLAHKDGNPFEGRDWKKIRVGEIIDPREVHWSESGTSVEEATKVSEAFISSSAYCFENITSDLRSYSCLPGLQMSYL